MSVGGGGCHIVSVGGGGATLLSVGGRGCHIVESCKQIGQTVQSNSYLLVACCNPATAKIIFKLSDKIWV